MTTMTNNPAIQTAKPANAPDVDVSILYQPWQDTDFNAVTIAERVISTALHYANLPESAAQKRIEISIALVSDESIRQLNREFRNKDKPTNVLSFEFEGGASLHEMSEYPLGDIVIAYETIEREAIEQEKSFESHYTHMILHGFLHLLGYDHIKDDEAEAMEAKEIEILREIGVENPYI